MNFIQPKPINSTIEVISELNKTMIVWKNPRGSSTKYLVVVFSLAWLVGWSFVLNSVINQILNEDYNSSLIFWLIGWSIGGIIALKSVIQLIRPAKPEKLILDFETLTFEHGTPVFQGVEIRGFENNREDSTPSNSKRKYSIPKKEVGEIRLERIGERQRLSLDHGAERIEIGYYLTEPEREWLFSVLKNWKGV